MSPPPATRTPTARTPAAWTPAAWTPGAWTDVCALAELLPDRGAAALVGGEQVALFRLTGGAVHAVGNYDPVGGAYVLSRGIVGSRGDRPVVFSPLHKQAYDLRTGRCLDDPSTAVPVYEVRVRAGQIEVGARRTQPG